MSERQCLAFENLIARGAHPDLHAFERSRSEDSSRWHAPNYWTKSRVKNSAIERAPNVRSKADGGKSRRSNFARLAWMALTLRRYWFLWGTLIPHAEVGSGLQCSKPLQIVALIGKPSAALTWNWPILRTRNRPGDLTRIVSGRIQKIRRTISLANFSLDGCSAVS
jgi:hypothetical protein